MSLNSTGPISLGGSTSGQSIELELGETGTQPISMGDSIVRGFLGVPSGAISLDIAHGKSLFAGTLQTTITQPSNAYANTYAGFGYSNAISDDGLTMIIGGPNDYAFGYGGTGHPTTLGAAWIFTRANTNTTTWTQQAKLLGSGGVGAMTASQYTTGFSVSVGWSVAISNDGNTVAIGSPPRVENPPSGGVDYGVGGVWVYTRSGTTWSQQAGPLTYTSNNCGTNSWGIGWSLAISGDGNTIAAGQPNYGTNSGGNANQGGVVVFVRSGTTWSAQSGLLQGSDTTRALGTFMGWSVSLSKDGNTLAFGGFGDGYNSTTGVAVGATWIFTRSGSTWSQQGTKKIGTGGVPGSGQGSVVALSGDGTVLATSDPTDNSNVGAIWIFTRSGSTWTQQGSKLVGTGGSTASGSVGQGSALALNYAGTLLAVGAYQDSGSGTTANGAMWMFKSNADAGTFTQLGSKIVGNNQQGVFLGEGISIANTAGTVVVSGAGAGAPYGDAGYSTIANQQVLVYN